MDLQNDPRFFQDNVLNKRLAALSGMSVVSGLMVSVCTGVLEKRKNLNFETWDGRVRCCNFLLLSLVLFLNTVATYVPMAQTYHTYRLETAGPTGFEIASSYYLNRNIVAWRHFSVFCLLNGMTFYLISYGVRLTVSFSEVATNEDDMVEPYCAYVMAWNVGL
ncbi:unnamed protein product [Durusdinium trenchii]|uniref:Uncharacterized protein n=1 Tax=Durusdinium trenchii TaxID=1381693 RepID=A0ABP0RXR2_9DINO